MLETQVLPVIPLRSVVVLPGEVVHCDVGRRKTLLAMQAAAAGEGMAFFCMQKDPQQNEPAAEDLYRVGTIGKIKQVFRIQGEGVHMLVTGMERGRSEEYLSDSPYFEAAIRPLEDIDGLPTAQEALRRRIIDLFEEYAGITGRFTSDQKNEMHTIGGDSAFTDTVARYALTDVDDKQALLEQNDVQQRMLLLLTQLEHELEIQRMDKQITSRVRERMDQNQREYYLREKLKVIHEELGDQEGKEADEYRARMEKKELPEAVRERLKKEIDRLSELPASSHEGPMARSFIELILDLPWTEETEDNLDIAHAREILDRDHYGMDKVKDRMLEYLGVQKLTGNPSGQILCLVGPPGVGKTSIVSAIAAALGRNFVRMSLGGVHDESEIRGHRRTYIGAMPGRVIAAMKQAKSVNPLLLFDEIDKMASDFRGDPAAAMLEVLDSAQNFAFTDHFLEIPYDLSHAILMTTANDASAIPKPLYDRMEIIEVPSYLATEKLEIAKHHLVPKQIKLHGLTRGMLRITDGQLSAIIDGYTREAGVRELERKIATVCRKAACTIAEGQPRVTMNKQKLEEYLGQPRHRQDALQADTVGAVNGLAWTSVGGELLIVEAAAVPGTGVLQLTGNLGDVMQESGKAAVTYVRSRAAVFGLPQDFYQKQDFHIHVPNGAVPKDGPSAGVTMTTALVSLLTGVPVRADTAMTGEISLLGRVMPIGGLREKLLAAVRAGVKRVILPEENRADLSDVPDIVKDALELHYASYLDEVIALALTKPIKLSDTPQPIALAQLDSPAVRV